MRKLYFRHPRTRIRHRPSSGGQGTDKKGKKRGRGCTHNKTHTNSSTFHPHVPIQIEYHTLFYSKISSIHRPSLPQSTITQTRHNAHLTRALIFASIASRQHSILTPSLLPQLTPLPHFIIIAAHSPSFFRRYSSFIAYMSQFSRKSLPFAFPPPRQDVTFHTQNKSLTLITNHKKSLQ